MAKKRKFKKVVFREKFWSQGKYVDMTEGDTGVKAAAIMCIPIINIIWLVFFFIFRHREVHYEEV